MVVKKLGKFIRFAAICSLLFISSLVTILYLTIENKPLIERSANIAPEHIERFKHIIDKHRRDAYPGKITIANILPEDIDIAINYLTHLFANGRAQTSLTDGGALLQLTYPLPNDWLSGYLNLEVAFTETNHFPFPQSLRIGNIFIPEFLTRLLTQQFLYWLQHNYSEFNAGLDMLQHISISPEGLSIIYRWNGEVFEKTSDLANAVPIINQQERESVLRYHLMLVNNEHFRNRTAIPLSEYLTSAMQLAARRSTNENNPAEENRAAILAITFHVLGLPFKLLSPETSNWPHPARLNITLDGRRDFAKHFMASAAITAYADTILSDAIGIYKEIEDSRSGSGFSFNDIAANQAGIRFAEQATASPASAHRLQVMMSSNALKDTDLMPYWSDLPEHLSESEFTRRFGGTDTLRYQHMIKKIEQRVNALKILN